MILEEVSVEVLLPGRKNGRKAPQKGSAGHSTGLELRTGIRAVCVLCVLVKADLEQ